MLHLKIVSEKVYMDCLIFVLHEKFTMFKFENVLSQVKMKRCILISDVCCTQQMWYCGASVEGDPCAGLENACMCPGRFDERRPAGDVFYPCQRVAHRIEEYDYENTSQV